MGEVKKYTFPRSKYNDPNYVSPKVFHGRSFVTNKDAKKRNWIFANKIDYNSREVATENNNEIFKYGYLGRKEIHENKKIIFRNSKYERILYFAKEGAVRYKDNQKRAEYYDKLKSIQDKHELSCLYESFISFEDNFFNENIKNKYTETEFFNKLKPQLENYILKNDFDLANVEYFVSFHTNTDSFHFHFDFIEKVPMRSKNKLKEKELGELRKNIMFELDESLKRENDEKLKKIQDTRKDVQNVVDNAVLDKYSNLLKKGSKLVENKKYRYYGDVKDDSLKQVIDNIKLLIIDEDEKLSKKLRLYKDLLVKKDDFDSTLYGKSDRRYSNKQLEELDKRLNNKIFQDLKDYSLKGFLKSKDIKIILDKSDFNYTSASGKIPKRKYHLIKIQLGESIYPKNFKVKNKLRKLLKKNQMEIQMQINEFEKKITDKSK